MTGEMLATYNETANKEAPNPWTRVRWYEEGPVTPESGLVHSLDWMYDKWNSSNVAIYHAGNSSTTAESGLALTSPQGRPDSERIFWYGGPVFINHALETRQTWEDLQQSPLKRVATQIPIGSHVNPIAIRAADGITVFVVHQASGKSAKEFPKILEELRDFSSDTEDQRIHESQPDRHLIRDVWHGLATINPEGLPTVEFMGRDRRREQGTMFGIIPETATPPVQFKGRIGLIPADSSLRPADYYARVFSLPEPETTDKPRFHPIVETFSRGFGDTIPDEETLNAATSIVEAAFSKAANADIEVDETDGSIAIQLRSKEGFLIVGEYSVEGELQANIYNDRDPNPDAGIQDLWVRHLPNVSPEDLIKWF